MNEKRRPVFSTFADSRTGNRGAVSMLESAIDFLTSDEHPGEMNVFTVYPKADKAVPQTPHVNLYNGSPINLVVKLIPLSVIYRILSFLHISLPDKLWGRDMQALLETDVCLMIGGTTFTDAQPVKILYNVFCVLPAIILGKKAMMYSQTLGPFKTKFNRSLAGWCLSRMDFIVPRGPGSLKNVQGLNLKVPVQHYCDSAFTLVIPDDVVRSIRNKYEPVISGKRVVGISVNSIVQEECEALGIDHNGAWVTLIDHLISLDYFVLLIPHSIRRGSKSSHNNDLIAVADIIDKIHSKDKVLVIDEPYNCKELRAVVGLAEYYMASRFHSMISALCEGVPVCVFGWGYQKYREVLQEFDLEEYCHDAAELSGESLIAGFEEIVRDADRIKAKWKLHLPEVQQSSRMNHETAWRLSQ